MLIDREKKTQNLLSFNRVSIRLLMGGITNHYKIRHISECVGYPGNNFYRSCLDEKGE